MVKSNYRTAACHITQKISCKWLLYDEEEAHWNVKGSVRWNWLTSGTKILGK